MRGKLWFVGGLAVGFVLGARAGRERYEELVLKGRKVLDHPTVQEAAGVAQAQANRLYTEGKDRLSHTRLGEKLANGSDGAAELGAGDGGTLADSGVGSGTKTPSSHSAMPASRAASSGSGANGTTY